jgi:hypothetical protein
MYALWLRWKLSEACLRPDQLQSSMAMQYRARNGDMTLLPSRNSLVLGGVHILSEWNWFWQYLMKQGRQLFHAGSLPSVWPDGQPQQLIDARAGKLGIIYVTIAAQQCLSDEHVWCWCWMGTLAEGWSCKELCRTPSKTGTAAVMNRFGLRPIRLAVECGGFPSEPGPVKALGPDSLQAGCRLSAHQHTLINK